MKKQLLRFTLYALMIYLTGSTLNPAFAANLNAGEPYTVRLIYFLPSGREPRPNIDADMDALIKVVQEDYARDMERHGFGRKTFTFETDTTGKAVVHHVNGQFTAAYYEDRTVGKVMEEIREHFDFSRNIYLIVVDSGYLISGYPGMAISTAAFINSIDKDLSGYDYLASHELRHTFGLWHDFSRDGRGFTPEISKCTAEFLDVHPYFNAPRQSPNLLPNTTIQMFPPSLVSPPNTIRLRFEVSDPDGLHQAQLLTPEVTVDDYDNRIGGFLACKQLTGTRSTVEFVTTALLPKTESVSLQMIDVDGNISWERYPIDMTSLLPPSEVVSIPDANLAAAVREAIGLAQGDAITSHTILELVTFDIRGLQITDLTGLEHAISLSRLSLEDNSVTDISALGDLTNLTELYLGGNSVTDISALGDLTNLTELYLGGNSVSDISALAGLTQLEWLELHHNSISDISALAGLTNLTTLELDSTSVSDISALGDLTNLTYLDLFDTSVSDISALGGLTNLTWLNLNGNSVTDISALAGLTQLTALDLNGNSISDISALAGLTNLTWLELSHNPISDISSLAGLTNLATLGFWDNSISDISALAGLTQLTELHLRFSFISDISSLAGLTNLTMLSLWGNSISDISSLAGLTQLEWLDLRYNSISDISSLAGLTNLTTLYLRSNPLSYASINTHIPTMQAKGIEVQFDPRTPTTLVKISGNQQGSPATPLSHPFVVEVRDEWDAPFEGIQVTFTVTVGGGTLSVIQTATNAEGKAESTLTLGPNLGTYTVSVSAAGVEQPVTFTAVAGEGVTIPDSNLRTAVGTALGVAAGVRIVPSELAKLTHLNTPHATIGNLTGLEFATNLTSLYLRDNSISDVSALAGLTQLTTLDLRGNSISDVSSLAGLTQLTTLDLRGNSISDVSALAGLTQLTTLDLRDNSISDVSALTGLTQLTTLNLRDNSVSDISALAGLTQLTWLHLGDNSISDVSALAGLTQLEWLGLGSNSLYHKNSISDISSLAGLTQLTTLNLGFNSVSDISSLAGLTQLEWLGLGGNSVSDISSLAGLTQLTTLNLGFNSVSDISPLLGLNLTGPAWSLAGLYLVGNPLSYVSINMHIPAMQAKGIKVEFDNQAHLALLKISGDNQKGASFAPLSQPFIVEAQDENGSALAGISVTFSVTAGGGTLSTTITRTDANGRAQSTLTLGPNLGTNTVAVSAAGIASQIAFYAISDTEPITADVNNDGVGNILDLILIASDIGKAGTNLAADVNRDGIVSILDLVLAAGLFEGAAAAPSTQTQVPETLTAVEVQGWLTDAISLEVKDVTIKRGVMVLEQLLISLTPKETELLANYPNPFNPETWIPYRLAEDGFVTLTIYDTVGQVVRTLDVGHRIAAVYKSRSKAIYWDGRNGLGEQVASGVYFYHLSAGDYSATRRMVILK